MYEDSVIFSVSSSGMSFCFKKNIRYLGIGKKDYELNLGIPDSLILSRLDDEKHLAMLHYAEERITEFLSDDVRNEKRIVAEIRALSQEIRVMPSDEISEELHGVCEFREGYLVVSMTAPYNLGPFLLQDLGENPDEGWKQYFEPRFSVQESCPLFSDQKWSRYFESSNPEEEGICLVPVQHLRLHGLYGILSGEYKKKRLEELNLGEMATSLNTIGSVK